MNVKGNDDKDDMVLKIVAMLITVVVVVVVDGDDDDDDDDNGDDDDDDNDNCGNGGGSVGCSVGDNYCKTEDYLYNDDNKNMLHKLGISRPINLLEGHLGSQALICRSQ